MFSTLWQILKKRIKYEKSCSTLSDDQNNLIEQRVYQMQGFNREEQLETIKNRMLKNDILAPFDILFIDDQLQICAEDFDMLLPVLRDILNDVSPNITMELVFRELGLNSKSFAQKYRDYISTTECKNMIEEQKIRADLVGNSDQSIMQSKKDSSLFMKEGGHVFENDDLYFADRYAKK